PAPPAVAPLSLHDALPISLVGVEAERQFAFAGLHQLCAPLVGGMDELPEPQRTALAVAFGQRSGAAPDRFLVGLAVLNLLAEARSEEHTSELQSRENLVCR